MESSSKAVQVKEEMFGLQENQTVSSEMSEIRKEEKTEPTPVKKIKMEDFPEENASIFILKEELFAEIFSYLNVWELMTVDKVCWLFRNIADQYFYRKITLLKVDGKRESPEVLANKVERFGDHATVLEVSNVSNDTKIRSEDLKPIWIHCSKVQQMSLTNVRLRKTVETSSSMKNVFKSLTCLELSDCRLNDELDFTSHFEILRIRDSSYDSYINCSFLPNLKDQLKELNLSCCYRMEILNSPHFATFCQDNSTLETLCFYYSDGYEDLIEFKVILKMIGNLKNLKTLKINDSMQDKVPRRELATCVPDLPKLTHLEINSQCFSNYYPFLLRLGDQDSLETFVIIDATLESTLPGFDKILCKFTKIKLLKFDFRLKDSHLSWIKCRGSLEHFKVKDSHVTDKGVLQLIQECPQLKILDLRWSRMISDDLIIRLIPVMNKRPHSLEIYVADTGISDSIDCEIDRRGCEKIIINFDRSKNMDDGPWSTW